MCGHNVCVRAQSLCAGTKCVCGHKVCGHEVCVCGQVTYVAEDNIVIDTPANPLRHSMTDELFDGFQGDCIPTHA